MKTGDLISALKALPEVRLRLFELAWQVSGDDGVDPKKLAFFSKELEEAIAEAKDYARATREAIECLIKMA